MKLTLTNFSLKHPWIVIIASVALTAAFVSRFPGVKFDNDPENMLSEDEPVRLLHNQVKDLYSLYDFVIVGVVNTNHPDGVFNVETLGNIHQLTQQLLSLKMGSNGLPVVVSSSPTGTTSELEVDLTPQSGWRKSLNVAFKHDPNRLFDEDGNSAIIGRELISPSVVDNIKQSELGSLKLEYLMEQAPSTREEALGLRDDAMSNPLYNGTLVSEDEKAICIYIPLKAKTYSYNVAELVRRLTQTWNGADRVLIAGQPVAQDTFGVEMLVQMATSAPLAGLAIFLLLLLFFRRLSLIIAPMLVAIISVLTTMGLLIGLGFDVHIMSSMIAIFLMPIAVADSVHLLSEFFDLCHKFESKAATMRHVIGHLFMPMLYTSLTTMAGFASLALTPIPPVRIFGLHVAFGVGLAWILTITFIPAYVMVAVSEKTMKRIGDGSCRHGEGHSLLAKGMSRLGRFSCAHWKLTLVATVLLMVVAVFGITRIQVNDNPVKWFTRSHDIRVADEVLNRHFGGTYTAYLTVSAKEGGSYDAERIAEVLKNGATERFEKSRPTELRQLVDRVSELNSKGSLDKEALSATFDSLAQLSRELDKGATSSWNKLADEINYLEPDGLTLNSLQTSIKGLSGVAAPDRQLLLDRLRNQGELKGEELLNKALEITDKLAGASFTGFISDMEAQLTAPLFKRPDMLAYIKELQQHLVNSEVVGKTSSAVDALEKAAYELKYTPVSEGMSEQEVAHLREQNQLNRSIPGSAAATGQVFAQLEGMKKKDSLFHLVTRDYEQVNIWVQLKSGDNVDMESVVQGVDKFIADNPPPVPLDIEWAGLTFLNVVWQDKMVRGMLSSLVSSFVVVLIMMIVLFRSPIYGVLAMIPLTVTIALIYGLIGIVGKDYDMPVAVLSALTLGLSVDFAIHFLERAREEVKKMGSWQAAGVEMFREPATAISRNAITIAVGFTPLLVAPLVPYKTVGFFLSTIMAVSWLSTLFILPAMLTLLRRWVFKQETTD